MKKYCSILIASSSIIMLSTSFTTSSSSFHHRSIQRSAFVHRPSTLRSFHQIYLQRSLVALHATIDDSNNNSNGDETTIDPSSIYKDDATILPSYQPPTTTNNNSNIDTDNSDGWGIADDWSTLSSGSSTSGTTSFDYVNNNYDTVINQAAKLLEEHENLLNGLWDDDAFDDDEESQSSNNTKDATYVSNANEDFADTAIEIISSNIDYNDVGVALYDTKKSSSSTTTSAAVDESTQKELQEEQEMAYMIGCNASPESYLIRMGKAIPELTDDIKYDPSLLLEKENRLPQVNDGGDRVSQGRANGAGRKIGTDSSNKNTPFLPLQSKMTPFFKEATEKMFNTHSINIAEGEEVEPIYVLDRNSISQWMTTCLHSPFKSNDLADQVSPPVPSNVSIGPHDPSVNAILSRYSQQHGSGQLTLDDFQMLYLEVAFAGYNRDIYHKKIVLKDEQYQIIPSIDAGIILQGRKNTEKMLKKASLSIIWRDLEGHDIYSPAENEHIKMIKDMEQLQLSISSNAAKIDHQNLLMDECLLFDEYTDRLSNSISTISDNESDMIGIEQSYNEYMNEEKKKEKSSHQLVEFAYDGKTTKWIRDGEFVFIDEETCIGCTQCAQISPSSFKMIEDTGRARTYSQRNTEDVDNAVMACPVNCMHYMSYDELKEMEVSRDEGDGRTDHRHFGGRVTHTPLHVAGRGSDANHKSSWYHYLKGKCHGSHSCPQRGCYDCPTYAPGKNPFFIERHKEAEHVRAKEFMSTGEADKWRKVVEL